MSPMATYCSSEVSLKGLQPVRASLWYLLSLRCQNIYRVGMQLATCHWQNRKTAVPKAADSHPAGFSEGRAMHIVERLAIDMPYRQASAGCLYIADVERVSAGHM